MFGVRGVNVISQVLSVVHSLVLVLARTIVLSRFLSQLLSLSDLSFSNSLVEGLTRSVTPAEALTFVTTLLSS